MAAQSPAGSVPAPERIGKYEIVAKIGQGAMGEVYKARDTVLDRFVAIKTMSSAVLGNEEMGQRFLREAQSAARLNHPNVVTLHEFGEDAGRFFMAMELLDGEDLSRLLKGGKLETLDQKLAIIEQILDGVAYAHAAGVIHRDLKPPNIHVQPNGHIKVMDFGLARLGESEITRAGTVMGTPHYMSPEQVRGEKTGPASDVFALGSVFYEMISGRRPFDADSMHGILFKVAESQPVPLNECCEGLPPVIVSFIWRALSKEPELRYQDAGQMREAFELCRRVMEGSLDEATAIAGMGEAPTILQSPGDAAATAMYIEPGLRSSTAAPSQRRPTSSLTGSPAIGSGSGGMARRGSRPSIRMGSQGSGGDIGSGTGAGSGVTASSRTGLILGGVAVLAAALIGAFFMSRGPSATEPAADRQAQAVFSIAIEAQLDSARRSLEFKDPEGAITAAERALQFDPANAAAQQIIGQARASLDQVEGFAQRARQAAAAGDLDEASAALSEVLDLMPKHPVAAELSEQLASRFQARADTASRAMKQTAGAARAEGASSLRAYSEATAQARLGETAYANKQYTAASQHFAEAQRSYEASRRDARDLATRRAKDAAAAAAVATPSPVAVPTATVVPAPVVRATPVPTPPPVAATPAPTAPPAPRPVRNDDAAVREVVANLARAIEGKDMALYKRLRPDLTSDEERRLADAFRNVASQEVDYRVDGVSISGDTATVQVTRSGRVAGQNVPSVRQVLRLARRGSGWVIAEIGQ